MRRGSKQLQACSPSVWYLRQLQASLFLRHYVACAVCTNLRAKRWRCSTLGSSTRGEHASFPLRNTGEGPHFCTLVAAGMRAGLRTTTRQPSPAGARATPALGRIMHRLRKREGFSLPLCEALPLTAEASHPLSTGHAWNTTANGVSSRARQLDLTGIRKAENRSSVKSAVSETVTDFSRNTSSVPASGEPDRDALVGRSPIFPAAQRRAAAT